MYCATKKTTKRHFTALQAIDLFKMFQFQDMWFLMVAVVLICIENTDCDFVQLGPFGNVVPVVACEGSHQVYAVTCVTSGAGGNPTTWLGWTSDGRSIEIDYGNDKYSTATDGVRHSYLLISGSELSLENNGEKYACNNPQSSHELPVLEEYASVLRVLSKDRCNEHEDLTTSAVTSLGSSTSPTSGRNKPLPKSTTVVNYAFGGGEADTQNQDQEPAVIYNVPGQNTSSLVKFVYVMAVGVCVLFSVQLIVIFKVYRIWTKMRRRETSGDQTIPEEVAMTSSSENII